MVEITEIDENQTFHFKNLFPNAPINKPPFFKGISSFDIQQYFTKWDLLKHSSFLQLNCSPSFDKYNELSFLTQLFNNDSFRKTLQISDKRGNMKPLDQVIHSPFTKEQFVPIKRLGTSFLNFSPILNRLYESGIVHRETGMIQKCFDSFHDYNLTISDKLRELFIFPEESEHCDLFDEVECNEFLFQIIKALLIGGGLNQFEDELNPIIEASRAIYKDLVTIQKISDGSLKITSKVFLIDETSGFDEIFPLKNAPGNFMFIIVDEDKVSVWYHAYVEAW